MLIGGHPLLYPPTVRMLITEGYRLTHRMYSATTAISVWAIRSDAFSINPLHHKITASDSFFLRFLNHCAPSLPKDFWMEKVHNHHDWGFEEPKTEFAQMPVFLIAPPIENLAQNLHRKAPPWAAKVCPLAFLKTPYGLGADG